MNTRLLFLLPFLFVSISRADIAVASNDGHIELVNGTPTPLKNPGPDTLAVIDFSGGAPKLLSEIEGVPGSVIGPPFSVVVTPDEHYALVTACMKVDPADPTKQTEDNRLTVVDLKATPPRALSSVTTGKGPAGLALNRQGTLALVANRGDGTISIFTVTGENVRPFGSLTIGNVASALGTVAITPDGRHALVSRDGDNLVTLLDIDTSGLPFTDPSVPLVKLAGRDLRTGFRPYGIDITRDGHYAVVGDVGYGNGDLDTIALVDLRAQPARVVDIVSVPQTPEGIKLSPDGQYCAVLAQDGSNKVKDSPFYHEHGQLLVYQIRDGKFSLAAHAPIGHWSQGAAFSADGKTILVCNMVEKSLQAFTWNGETLGEAGDPIPVHGGPVAIATAQK